MPGKLGALVAVLALVLVTFNAGLHEIAEGNIGVYYRGGAILDETTEPGFHFMIPFVTRVENIQVTLQTDVVTNIPCGTSGGVMIYFDKIEVVNRLRKDHALKTIKNYGVNYDKLWIFDKLHHEINQFCSSHTLQETYVDQFERLDEALAGALQDACDKWDTGIEIVSIRVTKPRLPEAVMRNYEAVEEQKTRLLVASEAQRVAQKEEETERIRATIKAQKEAEVSLINAEREARVAVLAAEKAANVSRIQVEKEVQEKEGEKRKAIIQSEIEALREKTLADSIAYRLTVEAEANAKRLTPAFLRYTLFQALANNTKIFFGESIPSIFMQWLDSKNTAAFLENLP